MSRTATMAYNDPRDRVAPYFALDEGELDAQPALLPVGWDAATEYHRLKKTLADSRQRVQARDAAVAAVVERARLILRHQSRPMVTEHLSYLEAPEGELDLDGTLERRVGPELRAEDVVVARRSPWRAEVVLICDMSLSMTGEKLALLAVAACVLGLTLPSEDLALVAFDTRAHRVKDLGERIDIADFARRLLEVPAQGYTCLEAGLSEGLSALRDASGSERAGILITDGVYNVGWDPRPLAPRFPHLHVIKIGDDDRDKGLCRDLADTGRGRLMVASEYDDLPEVAHRLIRGMVRGRS